MSDLNNKHWFINFNIKKYIKIDDIIDIIKIIDDEICVQENLLNENIIIKINRTNDTSYDYKCETNIPCDIKFIETYFNFKFKQIENKIKFSYDEFGDKWYIDFNLVNL